MKQRIQLLTMLLLFATITAYGQLRQAKPTNQKATFERPTSDIQFRQEQDTVFFPAAGELCGNFVTSYVVTDPAEWGFVAGVNSYGDLEKAQRLVYTANTPYRILEVWGFFAVASPQDTGTLRMKIYSIDTVTGEPDSLLGQTDSLLTSDIEIDEEDILPTIFPVSDSIVLTDTSFFVSLDLSMLYEAGDTVALFMTENGCGLGADTWELLSDTTWLPIDLSWELDANWIVAAVVEFDETTDVEDPFVAQKGLQIFSAMPNPTNNWVELPYQLEASTAVMIEVFSTDGRLLQRINRGHQFPGRYKERINVQNLSPGTYVYSIRTKEARLMSRFVVGR